MYSRADDKRATAWSKAIKERDNYKCRICKKYGVSLNSHHILSWDKFVEHRYDLNNGITLCVGCHEMFHSIYGKGKNTPYQFKQFEKTLEAFKVALKEHQNTSIVERHGDGAHESV